MLNRPGMLQAFGPESVSKGPHGCLEVLVQLVQLSPMTAFTLKDTIQGVINRPAASSTVQIAK